MLNGFDFVDTEIAVMAHAYLREDLQADPNDPDYPRWLERCKGLYKRYMKIRGVCPTPLGKDWPDEYCDGVDETLDKIERKIKAAEDVLG